MAYSHQHQQPLSYCDLVKAYCSNSSLTEKWEKTYDDMLTIVGHSELDCHQQHFHEIMNGLNDILHYSKDCKKLSSALTLLTDFVNVNNYSVSEIWRSRTVLLDNLQNSSPYKHWSIIRCENCEYVRRTVLELGMRFSAPLINKPLTKCQMCQEENVKKRLPCEHSVCRSCLVNSWEQDLPDRGRKTGLTCPIQRCTISQEWLATSKLLDKAKPYKKSNDYSDSEQGAVETNQFPCPKCRHLVFKYPDEGSGELFVECILCQFSFCTRCLQAYHGPTECSFTNANSGDSIPEQNFGFGSSTVASTPQNLVNNEKEECGAIAKPYELAFYSPENVEQNALSVFCSDDVSLAFQSLTRVQQPLERTSWPWESTKYSSYHHFAHPYESLNEGNWVEDELLEKAMKNFIQQHNQENTVGVLESFVMNWSTRKHYEDGEFVKIIAEKKMLEKELVLALINTDICGHGGHWILGSINLHHKLILLQDSSFVQSSTFYQKFHFYLLHVLHVAHILAERPFDALEWKLCVSLDSVQQQNAYDCGPLVVANAFAIVLSNRQLDKRPSSGPLRAWILDVLTKTQPKTVEGMEEVTENNGVNVSDKDFNKIEPFCPIGLKIAYQFFAGQECTDLVRDNL